MNRSIQQHKSASSSSSSSADNLQQLVLKGLKKNRGAKDFAFLTLDQHFVSSHVIVSKYNPRDQQNVSITVLNELMADIKKNGQLEPVWAYEEDGKYHVLSGSRRLRATSLLDIPLRMQLIKHTLTPAQAMDIAIALATTKELSFLEKGRIFSDLEESRKFKSLRDIAKYKGVSPTFVSEAIKAYRLPQSLKNCFPNASSLGKPICKSLEVIADAMRIAANTNLNDLRQFELDLSNLIDSEMISHELYTKKLKTAEKKQINTTKKLIKAAKSKGESTDGIQAEMEYVDVSDNLLNVKIKEIIFDIFKNSPISNTKKNGVKVTSNLSNLNTSTYKKISLSSKSTDTSLSIDLNNITEDQQTFALELNQIFIDIANTTTQEPAEQSFNNQNFNRLSKDEQFTIAKLFNELINIRAKSIVEDKPNNVAQFPNSQRA